MRRKKSVVTEVDKKERRRGKRKGDHKGYVDGDGNVKGGENEEINFLRELVRRRKVSLDAWGSADPGTRRSERQPRAGKKSGASNLVHVCGRSK